MLSIQRRCGLEKLAFGALFVVLSAFPTRLVRAAGCSAASTPAPCFDANSLWLPAGRAMFLSLPDTRVNAPGRMNFGFAAELLHLPVVAHVSSPDNRGRDVRVVGDALDASLFFALGMPKNFELSLTLPTRLYQNGAGVVGVSSQSGPPIEQTALRDPRLGAAYSLDDLLGGHELGLRLALEISLPFGDATAFAGERSVVVLPSATFAWQITRVALRASLGARLRSAVEFGDVRLGDQGFVALGAGLDLLDPGLLFLSVEGFALPPLGSSRASTANASLTSVSLFPAEWLFAVRSSLRPHSSWSLAASAGTGLPFSSETRLSSGGSDTAHFLGVTEPEWRTLMSVRFAPE